MRNTHRAPLCSPPGGFRSAVTASSTAIRISAITRCSCGRRDAEGDQSPRLWLHPHLPAAIRRAAWSISITGCSRVTSATWSHAYESWGFRGLSQRLIEALNIWARFIYGPLLDDRVRTIADGMSAVRLRPAGGLRRSSMRCAPKARLTIPREFVFMDRAAIGLGAAFVHSRRQAQFLPAVQRSDRRLQSGGARRPPKCSPCAGGSCSFTIDLQLHNSCGTH